MSDRGSEDRKNRFENVARNLESKNKGILSVADAEDIVLEKARRLLETDCGSVFSKKEVFERLKSKVSSQQRADDLAEQYKEGNISRRKFLQLMGLTGTAFAFAGTGYFMGEKIYGPGDAITGMATGDTINLADRGLSPGGNIDPVLDEVLGGGVSAEIIIPGNSESNPYTTKYQGSGWQSWDPNSAAKWGDVTIRAEDGGHAYIKHPEGASRHMGTNAFGSTVKYKDITFLGGVGKGQGSSTGTGAMSWSTYADSSGHVIFENVNLPDGVRDGRTIDSVGFIVQQYHSGKVTFRNCHVEGFSNNGIYGSIPGRGGQGVVGIECCLLANNNIAQFKLSSEGSYSRNSVILVDSDVPPLPHYSGNAARGFFYHDGNGHVTLENVDFIHERSDSHHVIDFAPQWAVQGKAQCTFKNLRILHNGSSRMIKDPNNVSSPQYGFEFQNINISGDGNLNVPGYWPNSICVNNNCEQPTRDKECVSSAGTGSTGSSGGSSGSGGSGSSESGTSAVPHEGGEHDITLSGGSDSEPVPYLMLVDGDILEAKGSAKDAVFGNKIIGTLNGQADTYKYDGRIKELNVAEPITVKLDGEELSQQQIINRFGNYCGPGSTAVLGTGSSGGSSGSSGSGSSSGAGSSGSSGGTGSSGSGSAGSNNYEASNSGEDMESLPKLSASSNPAIESVETLSNGAQKVKVAAGADWGISIGDNDKFQKIIVDISASRSTACEFQAFGSDWVIRNVAVVGKQPTGDKFNMRCSAYGECLIENCYFGDGGRGSLHDYTGIYVGRNSEKLTIRNCNVSNWKDNAVYASDMGAPAAYNGGSNHGTLIVQDSYFENNIVSSIRLGTDSSRAENCVVNGGPHRGCWAYWNEPTFVNVDASVGSRSFESGEPVHDDKRENPIVMHLKDCAATGGRDGVYAKGKGQLDIQGGVESNPRTDPPTDRVPMSPEDVLTLDYSSF
jgi:hypothetical protein